MVGTHGPERVGQLFKLLGLMANAPEGEWETVASEWMGRPDDDGARSAGEAGLDYIFSNLTGDIRLTTAARLAYMSEPTFSKYFKRATGLTFSNMVKKLRVAHARRLLDSTDHPVTRVASLSGYHNMANFNRQFLAEVGMHARPPTAGWSPSQKPPNEVLSLGLKARPGGRGDSRGRVGRQPAGRRASGARRARRGSAATDRYSCTKVSCCARSPNSTSISTNASGRGSAAAVAISAACTSSGTSGGTISPRAIRAQ